ncbi:isocitrate lyase/PEP mutase family protein [Kushneria konosiri]|uniref:Carboxyvinyl-carboxyphosphonate phosphorylmutase n=1 Tax=Kushneria konosiri TaxID=698828 RepID=A0A2Z2H803_9GAMM|nr:isocitrate lyase/PEP mutase family protein [Kushneria konosiri]ARS53569.1 carboxyvinyl-carboxyphosphonate phosphorylmutase [Kushneria konosiri]
MSIADTQRRNAFRRRIMTRNAMLMPGVFNALSARIVEDAGFEALYLTGAGVSNMSLGLPDMGFIGLNEVAEHTARVREAVELPLMVDADTGFGNALNVRHTVRTLERSGADAIQLEDQVMPKKCGHFSGKQIVSTQEMIGRIKAAVDSRQDDHLQIVARTDAAAVHGIEHAIERAHRFAEAGADILFIEATESLEDIRRLPALFETPLLINLVIGGKTPTLDRDELDHLGYAVVLYANAALQSAVCGMQRALPQLLKNGRLDEDPQLVASFSERQRLVNKTLFDDLEARYSDHGH